MKHEKEGGSVCGKIKQVCMITNTAANVEIKIHVAMAMKAEINIRSYMCMCV